LARRISLIEASDWRRFSRTKKSAGGKPAVQANAILSGQACARDMRPASVQEQIFADQTNEPEENVMRYALLFAAALLTAAGHAQTAAAQTAPLDLVRQGVEAMGADKLWRSFKRATFEVGVKHWEPGQSYSVNGDSRFLGDSIVTITADLTTHATRLDWMRDMKYPAAERLKYSEIFFPTYGAVVNDKGEILPMSGIRHAAESRELVRALPQLMLLHALDNPQSVAAIEDQELDHQTWPAVAYTRGATRFIILFDRSTKLPAAVRTRDEDNIWGDSNYDLVFGDWDGLPGYPFARSLSYRLNAVEVQHVTFNKWTLDGGPAPDVFGVPEAVKDAAGRQPVPSAVPYQWVLRRIFLGRFTDSDAIYFPPGGSFKLVELAPNVQHVQGGGANNLIVNLKDGILVVDAPVDEGQSRWVIDAAKAKYPGKPIKYLVLSHHHMDHTGGMRAFAAEGATVIVPAPDKAYFEQVISRPHTLEPDAEEKAMKPAAVEEVKDTLTIKDDTVEIRLYNIPNPHVEGMLIAHVVKDNILWVTDLVSPRGPITRSPGTVAVGEALRKCEITAATIAGGHGTTVKQDDIAPALAMN
jgi:glyoxylase-like metal-dependent hydrolase (beta-lactamase superfamily II)